MRHITVKVDAVLHARSGDIYATIADYRHGHPNILPKKHLYDLHVEEGGYGAGTIIRFKSRILGMERSFYQRVSEPEPGKILVEQDIDSGKPDGSTFTVKPTIQEGQTHVEISTLITISPGFQGLIERLIIPMALAPIYRQELQLLEVVAQKKATMVVQHP